MTGTEFFLLAVMIYGSRVIGERACALMSMLSLIAASVFMVIEK
jgi:hypothetical protein